MKITKQLDFIITCVQKYHLDKQSLKIHKLMCEKELRTLSISKSLNIEILDVSIEKGYVDINPLIQNYKKVRVFKDKFELMK